MIRSDLEAVLLVLSFEQLRLKPYDDGVGVLTNGWGHRILPSESHLRKTITREQANALFLADFAKHEKSVEDATFHSLNAIQLGACTSLAFNIGAAAFAGSSVARFIVTGELDMVPSAFRMWNKGTVGGKRIVLAGLTDRREAEVQLWLKGAEGSGIASG